MSVTELDVTRAVAVLNAAMRHRMVPQGAIPEADADKIVEAEKVIELARQAHQVAQTIGTHNVPNFDAINDVLFEADVTLGIGSDGQPTTPAAAEGEGGPAEPGSSAESAAPSKPLPSEPPVASPVSEMHLLAKAKTNEFLFTHVGCDGGQSTLMSPLDDIDPQRYAGTVVECGECVHQVPVTQIRHVCGEPDIRGQDVFCEKAPHDTGAHMGGGQTWDSYLDGQPTASAQQPSIQAAEPVGPQKDEIWVDEGGNQWKIVRYDLNRPDYAEVENPSGDETIVPRGFLKERLYAAASPGQSIPEQQTSSTSPSPSSSLPSSAESSSPSATPSPEPTPPSPGIPPRDPSGGESEVPSLPNSSASSPSSSSTSETFADDAGGDEQYQKVLDRVDAIYQPRAMPTPMDLETPPSGIPDDLTQIGPDENRRLHSQFNALAARARFLYSIEKAKSRDCDRVRKKYMKGAMRKAREELGKSATVTEVELLATDDENVQTWTERVQHHSDRADAYKTFFDMYSENVTVLSRDFTMRDLEHQGS